MHALELGFRGPLVTVTINHKLLQKMKWQNIHKYRESSCIKIIQRSDNYLTNKLSNVYAFTSNIHAQDIIGAHTYMLYDLLQ